MFFRVLCISFLLIVVQLSLSAQITVINPLNSSVFDADSVRFSWSDNNTGDFELNLSTNANFITLELVDTVFGLEELKVENLSYGTYYWRIRNLNTGLTWSPTYSFELINIGAMTGLSFWLKPESNFVTNGSNDIASWDNSVSNNHAVQAINSSQPLKIEDAINSHPIVRFDGVNDHLAFTTELDIREAFIVCKHNTGSQSYAPILGDIGSQPDFHGGVTTRLFNTTFTSSKIVNGSVALNGQSQGIATFLKPKEFSVVSVSTTDSVKTNAIARDRGFTSRSWAGEYAEVIFFNDSLGPIEKDQINDYLIWKYTPFPFLGKDQVVCGSSISLGIKPSLGYSNITWSSGALNVDSIEVTQNGTYWISVESFGMTFRDTVVISGIIPKPQISISSDVLFCFGDSITVNYTPVPGFQALWPNGDTTNSTVFKDFNQAIYVSHSDTSGCIAYSDEYQLFVDSLVLNSTLGPDRNICIGGELALESSSPGPLTYQWSTGDTSAIIFPAGLGLQDISLNLSNSNNCIFQDTITVNILNFQTPTVQFNSDTVCLNDQTQFSDLSAPAGSDEIISWAWYFGDQDSSFIENPMYAFNAHNNLVSLTVETDSGCIGTVEQLVINHQLPDAIFDDFIVCAKDSYQVFNNSFVASPDSINSYSWLIGGESFSSPSPTVYFANQGIENIQLIVETDKACKDTLDNSIEVFPALIANFAFDNTCLGDTTQFYDTSNSFSVVSKQWDFDFFNQTSSQANPNFFFPNTGNYNVKLAITNAIGCASDTTIPVEIKSLPIADALIADNCLGSPTSFYDNSLVTGGSVAQMNWVIENNALNGDSVEYIFDDVVEYFVKHEITDDFGCKDDTTFSFIIHPLPVVDFDFTPNYGTAPITIQFVNETTGAIDYLWDFGDNNNTSLAENPDYTYTSNGVYTISLTAENQFNCRDSIVKTIPIIPTELDVEISNLNIVSTTLIDGSTAYKARVTLKNVGSRMIENIDFKASINQETKIVENWTGSLSIGQSILYELSSSFFVSDPALLDYLCVEAFNVNDNTEINIANNKVCKLQQGSVRFSNIYPNPSTDYAFMDIVTAKESNVEIVVFDLIGKEVLNLGELNLSEGFNQVYFNCANFQAGKYFVQMIFQDEVYSQSLIIRNK